MKHRKIFSAVVALIMMMALAVPASAAPATVKLEYSSITVTDLLSEETIKMDYGDYKVLTVSVGTTVKLKPGAWMGESYYMNAFPMAVTAEGTYQITDGESVDIYRKTEFTASTEFLGIWCIETQSQAEDGMSSWGDEFILIVTDGNAADKPAETNKPAQPTPSVEPTQPTRPTQPSESVEADTYTVKAGDTWAQVALNHYGSYGAWRQLWTANGQKALSAVGTVTLPEKVGTYIRLPAQVLAEGEQLYTVKSGDTLGKIALEYFGNMEQYKEIFQRNNDRLKNANMIYEGQVLVLPAKPAAR